MAHVVGKSRDVAMVFFEDVLAARLGEEMGLLKPMPATSGVRRLQDEVLSAPVRRLPPKDPTAWLPTERVARAWQEYDTPLSELLCPHARRHSPPSLSFPMKSWTAGARALVRRLAK